MVSMTSSGSKNVSNRFEHGFLDANEIPYFRQGLENVSFLNIEYPSNRHGLASSPRVLTSKTVSISWHGASSGWSRASARFHLISALPFSLLGVAKLLAQPALSRYSLCIQFVSD